MKFFLSLLGLGLLLGVACTGFVLWSVSSPGPLKDTKLVLIERGSGMIRIADTLKDEGVIANATVFKIAAMIKQDHGTLKAGEYEFPARISMLDALALIRSGKVFERKITIPEGYTVSQIIRLLDQTDTLSGTITRVPLDGSLLPETYHYIRGDERQSIIDQMERAMTKTLEELWPTRAANLPFDTPLQAVTLASIIEKETGVGEEREKIAGVFMNRLRLGMPLQSDPTVIYAMTKGDVQENGQGPIGRRLLSRDLDIDSPYNTYRYKGLPPGPIANPGRAAIAAALGPENHAYLYFVADGTGGHAFGKTLAEHNANVARWRRVRAGQE